MKRLTSASRSRLAHRPQHHPVLPRLRGGGVDERVELVALLELADPQLPHQQVHRLARGPAPRAAAGSTAGARARGSSAARSKPSISIPHSSFVVKSIGPSMRSRPRSRSQPLAASTSAGDNLADRPRLEEAEHAVAAALELVPAVVDLGGDPPDDLAVALGREVARPRRARSRGSCRGRGTGGARSAAAAPIPGRPRCSRNGSSMKAFRSHGFAPTTGRIHRFRHAAQRYTCAE